MHWIRHEMKDLIMSVLLDPRTAQRGYFNPDGLRRLLDEHFTKRRNHSGRIWRLLIFELWHRNFLETRNLPGTSMPLEVGVSATPAAQV
ncbi:MAG: hypothetical protein DMG97_22455 [Acidobacteria bacterium]|nr:MAG: hypothetical protein DMG97_22455 [Acidobacteriota bacterium]